MKLFSIKIAFAFLCLFLMLAVAEHHAIAEDKSGFLSITGPCDLTFPEDHGSHPGFRTEWWYYTGNLQAASGKPYGFQLTFFRRQISASDAAGKWPQPHSAWRTQQIFLAHAAITDISKERHLQSEMQARQSLKMAGVTQKADETHVFLKNWSLKIRSQRHVLRVSSDNFSYALTLQSLKPPVLHGQAGYSRKGSTPERASCYYSLTRLKTEGTLTIGDEKMTVAGFSWMDHEFSSAPLEPDIVGWDWFSLQLSDQTEVMIFLLRKQDRGYHPASAGTFIDQSGRARHLTKNDFRIEVLDRWKSSDSAAVYPVRWRVTVFPLAIRLTVAARIFDQEMQTPASTAVTYWEGSVSAGGSVAEHPVTAMGYVELTGYAKSSGAPM